MTHGYYCQIPGHLSRRGVIDVGLKCVHSCVHCFYKKPDDPKGPFDFMRHAEWRDLDQLKAQARNMAENGFLTTDITGGEPGLYPGIVDLVQECTDAGLAARMITLGQFLDRPAKGGGTLLKSLLSAGMVDFRFSCHGHDEETFRAVSGGSLDKLLSAMRYLDEIDFEYTMNATILEQNYRHLPALAKLFASHNVYYVSFLYFMPHYDHALKVDGAVRPIYAEAAPYLREAVDILENKGIAVGVRYAPLCTIAGLEKNHVGQVGVRHDPHEWMNMVEHSGAGDAYRESRAYPMMPREPAPGAWVLGQTERGPYIGRGTREGNVTKVFTNKCQQCSALMVCDGIDRVYVEEHGTAELIPYMFDQRGMMLDRERLEYLAGHVVKLTPGGKPSTAISRLLRWWAPTLPKISVVIANYNHGAEIARCLQSLADQTWVKRGGQLEVIVVDDASTDDSVTTLRSTLWAQADSFRLVCRDTNSGGRPAVPRNQGLKIATGNLLCCLDPDDYLSPTYFEEIFRVFRDNSKVSIVYTGHDTFGEAEISCVAPPFNAEQEVQQNFIACMSVFRREVFEDTEGYDEDHAIAGVEDWNLWVSAIRLGHIAMALPRQLAHYCRSTSGIFETVVMPNFEEKRKEVYRRNQEIYSIEFLDANLKDHGVIGGFSETADAE